MTSDQQPAAEPSADTSPPVDETSVDGTPETSANESRRLIRSFLYGALLLLILRLFVAAPLGVPSGSMRPTPLEGDVVLVSLLSYRIRSPRTFPFTDLRIPQLDVA